MSKKKNQRSRLKNLKESREEFLLSQMIPDEPEPDQPQLPPPPNRKIDPQGRDLARNSFIEHKIQQAMVEGAFDNLPGAGRPLNLEKNPYTDPSMDLAYGLLKNNRLAPEWIERDKDIRRKLEIARERLARVWQSHQHDPSEERWQAAIDCFSEELDKLNRAIDDFNLLVPILSAQRPRLRLVQEVKRITDLP